MNKYLTLSNYIYYLHYFFKYLNFVRFYENIQKDIYKKKKRNQNNEGEL